jgi:hypothetical protein
MASLFLFLPEAASNTSAQTIHRFSSMVKGTGIRHVGAAFDLEKWSADVRFYSGTAVTPLKDAQQVQEFLNKSSSALLLLPEEKLDSISQGAKNFKVLSTGPYVGHGLWNKNLRQKKEQTVVLVRVE